MRASAWAVLWMAVLLSPLPAQSTDSDDAVVDSLLNTPSLTWEQAAWLVGRAVGSIDEGVSSQLAAQKARESHWVPDGIRLSENVDAAGYAYLLARALELPGGVMYTLFPSPRYALRELQYRRLVPVALAPDSSISGQDALVYLQNALAWKESRS